MVSALAVYWLGRLLGYGEVVRTREKRGRWVRVERSGAPNGWIAKGLLWGW
jgi:hypothetical protein